MRSRAFVLLFSFALCLAGALAATAQNEELVELRADLEEHFELLPLSDGTLLRPRAGGSGPRGIEISGSAVALDGEAAGSDELRARLGEEIAALVLAFAALDESGQRQLLATELVLEQRTVAELADEAVVETVDASDGEQAGEEEASEEAASEEARARVRADAAADAADKKSRRRSERKLHRRSGDSEVAFAGSLTVEEDEVTDDVLVFGGFLKVEGKVEGDATVIGGSATIEGEVTGDVTAIGGPVRLEEGSYVHGEVSSVGGRVYRADGARVGGEVEQVSLDTDFSFGPWTDWKRWQRWSRHGSSYDLDFNPWSWWTGLGWSLTKLLLIAGLAWLSLLVARRPIERMERRIGSEPWKTGLVGLLAQVLFFPALVIVIVFLAISIIGIPLIFVVLLSLPILAIIGWLGLVAVAGRLGGWFERRFDWQLSSPFWAVLVGFAAIAVLSVVGQLLDFGVAPMRFVAGMFLFFGCIASWAAWTIGFGAAVLTRFGSAESWQRAEELVAPLPPLPSYGEGDSEQHAVDGEGGGPGAGANAGASADLDEDE